MKLLKWLALVLLLATVALAAWLVEPDRSVEQLAEWAGPASRFVEVDGLSVHYRDEGPRDAPVLLLLHGTAASLHTWDGWVAVLGDRYRTLRLDLPAYGLTGPRSDRDYRIETYAQFVDGFVSALALQAFHLAGNSLGGNIAWQYALEHPERVRSLTLIDASGYPRDPEAPVPLAFRLARTPVLGEVLRRVSLPSVYRASLEDVYADDGKITDELVRRYYELGLREGNRQAFLDRARMLREDHHERIGEIRTPTLILWGAQDTWIPPADAARFLADLPNAVLAMYADAGHVPMEEIPMATANCVAAFMDAAAGVAGSPAAVRGALQAACAPADLSIDAD